MDAVVKEEEVSDMINMIEPKKEAEDTMELKEPKVELFDEQDVKMEELDEDQYQHMIPYEYRDYLEQHAKEKQPMNNRKRHAKEETISKQKTAECQICRKMIALFCFATAENHAATHTNINRSACPVEGCVYKSWLLPHVVRHMRQKHKMANPTVNDVVRKELSEEEEDKLREKLEECFPGVTKPTRGSSYKYNFTCQICDCTVSECSMGMKTCRRSHALVHTDIMLYECIDPNCNFETKHFSSFRAHQKLKHGNTQLLLMAEHDVSEDKALKVREVLVQCFPELKEVVRIEQGMSTYLRPKTERRRQSCDVCHKVIHAIDLTSKHFRRSHAMAHTDLMLYKCCKEDCHFKAPYRYAITNHQKWMHQMSMNDMPVIRIELTDEQEIEIKAMMDQCFPEWKDE